jgi:hypothetical protein
LRARLLAADITARLLAARRGSPGPKPGFPDWSKPWAPFPTPRALALRKGRSL